MRCKFSVVIIAALILLNIYLLFKDDSYTFTQCSYIDYNQDSMKNISIEYYEIKGLNDDTIEETINAQIRKSAYGILSDFASLYDIEIKSRQTVEFANKKYLSTKTIKESFANSQAYPLIRCSTQTFSLKTGEIIKLDDIININDDFVNTFFDLFVNITEYEDDITRGIVDNLIEESIDIQKLAMADYPDSNGYSSYITKKSLIICIPVQKAVGSFAIYEADFSGIEQYLKINIS